jgi:hypothetical protein
VGDRKTGEFAGDRNHFVTTNNAGQATSTDSCKEATYEGTVSETTNTEITATPTYPEKAADGSQNCTFGGGIGNATVKTNHCAFKLTGGPTDANGDAPFEIECETGSKIETEGGGCIIKIGPQTEAELEKGAHYIDTTNPTTGKQNITVEATVTSIAYEKMGPVLNCAFAGNGTNAHFETKVTASAFVDNSLQSGTAKTTPIVGEGFEINLTGNTNAT